MSGGSLARLFLRGLLSSAAALTGFLGSSLWAAVPPAPAWEQVISDRRPSQAWDPFALRRLADGSFMVVFGPNVVRYDKDGAILSNVSVNAVGAAAVAIDPFGSIAVVSQRSHGLSSEQDFSVMKFDWLTGKAMWNDRVWHSMGPFTKAVAASFNTRGDLFVISAFSGGSEGFGWATICFEGRTGAVRWGPARYLSTGQASAVGAGQPFDLTVDAAGNVLVTGYVATETTPLLATIRYDGLTGATLWGPATLDVSLPSHPSVCGICIDPPVSLKVALDRTGGVFIATASYKYDNLGNLADPKWLLVKHDLASGRRLWGPVSTNTGGYDLPLSMAVDGNGDLVVAISGSGSIASVLTKWRGSTGQRLWGPVSSEYGITTMEFDGRGDLFVTGTVIPSVFTQPEARTSKFEGATGRRVWESGTGGDAASWDSKGLVVDLSGNVSVAAFNVTNFQLGIVGYSGFDGANRFGPAPIEPGRSASFPFTVLMTSREESVVVTMSGLRTFVRKFAKDGSLIWGPFVFLPSDSPYGIAPMAAALDPNEDLVVAGEIPAFHYSYVEKISGTTGSLVWGPIQLEKNWDRSTLLAIDRSGDVFVVVRSFEGWVLRKFSGSTGSPIWGPVSYETSDGAQSSALAVDSVGDVFITGATYAGHPIWTTFKYSGSDGKPIWGPVSLDGLAGNFATPTHIAIDGRGDAIVMGGLSTRTGESCATIKYSGGTGMTIWGPSLLAIGLGRPQQLALDSAGDIFVSAEMASAGVNNDALIVKYAGSTGDPLWGPVGYHLNGFEPVAIAVDGLGDVEVAAPQSNGTDTDWFLAKLSGHSGNQIWTDSFDSGFPDVPAAVAAIGNDFVVVGSAAQQSRIARYTGGLAIQPLPEELSRVGCGETYRSELGASNASPPVSWSITEGHAPPGITLDSLSGVLSGTPERQGNFMFVAEAKDSTGATARRMLTIDVLDATPLLEIQVVRNNTCLYGGYVLFLPESHASYRWGPGGETESVIDVCPLQPTVYSVVVSDESGCQRRGSIELSAYRIASPPREPVILPGRRIPSPRIRPR